MVVYSKADKSQRIVTKLIDYAESKGLIFCDDNGMSDTSPYRILKGNSSISYRKSSRKWPGNRGIVIFATEEDADEIVMRTGLVKLGNEGADFKNRPYAIFVPDSKYDLVIDALLNNPQNRQ